MAALHTDYKMARLAEQAKEDEEGTRVINLISRMRSSSSSLGAMSLNDDVTEQGRLSSPSLSVHPSQPSFTTSGHPSGDGGGGVGGDLHLIDRTDGKFHPTVKSG